MEYKRRWKNLEIEVRCPSVLFAAIIARHVGKLIFNQMILVRKQIPDNFMHLQPLLFSAVNTNLPYLFICYPRRLLKYVSYYLAGIRGTAFGCLLDCQQ